MDFPSTCLLRTLSLNVLQIGFDTTATDLQNFFQEYNQMRKARVSLSIKCPMPRSLLFAITSDLLY